MTPIVVQHVTLLPGGLVVRHWADPETGKARHERTATIETCDLYRGALSVVRGVRLIDVFRLVDRNIDACAELLWPSAHRCLAVGVRAARRRASTNHWLRLRWPGVVQDRLDPLPRLAPRMEFDMIQLRNGVAVGPDFAVDLVPLAALAFERLLIHPEQTVAVYGSTDALRSRAHVERRPTLAQVIDAIFYELTWWGAPDQTNEITQRLHALQADQAGDEGAKGLDEIWPDIAAKHRLVRDVRAQVESLRGRPLERPLQWRRCRDTLSAALDDASLSPDGQLDDQGRARLEAAFADVVARYVPRSRRIGATLTPAGSTVPAQHVTPE